MTQSARKVARLTAIGKSEMSTENPELADRFNRTLEETVEAMDSGGVHYAFIGGIAASGLGRPRSTRDIDLFVTPEDAERALRALAKKGFRTEKTDPSWLYKGWKDDILVDVIFKSKGEIYLDSEMFKRLIVAEFHGRQLKLVAPEDLLIIKAAAHSELTPSHWHDAIALLSHARIDWEYLLRRARRAPRRVLSLLLYAQSNDIGVPNWVIHELYRDVFGDQVAPPSQRAVLKEERLPPRHAPARHGQETLYSMAHLREALAEDPRINELDLEIEQAGDQVVLRGEVNSVERRNMAEQVAREYFPDTRLENQIHVMNIGEPKVEEIR